MDFLQDLEAIGRQQGQAAALDPERTLGIDCVRQGLEPLENIPLVDGLVKAQVDLTVISPT